MNNKYGYFVAYENIFIQHFVQKENISKEIQKFQEHLATGVGFLFRFFLLLRCYAIAICSALFVFLGKVVGFYLCTMMHAHRELVEVTGKSMYNEHRY